MFKIPLHADTALLCAVLALATRLGGATLTIAGPADVQPQLSTNSVFSDFSLENGVVFSHSAVDSHMAIAPPRQIHDFAPGVLACSVTAVSGVSNTVSVLFGNPADPALTAECDGIWRIMPPHRFAAYDDVPPALAVFAIGAIAALLPRIRATLPRPRLSSTFVFCAAASTVLIVIGSSKTNSPPDRLMRGIVSRITPPLSTNGFPFGFAVWPFDHITAGVVSNMDATGELVIPDAMLATGLALSRVDIMEGAATPPPLPSNSVEVARWRLLDADNRCVTASLPFAFPLGDAEYDSVDILSNGRLSFGDTMLHRRPEGGVPAATNLFNHATVIAPAWGDTVLATWNDAAVLVATNSNAATIAWRNAFNPAAPSATNSLVECNRMVCGKSLKANSPWHRAGRIYRNKCRE